MFIFQYLVEKKKTKLKIFMMISSIVFIVLLIAASLLFAKNVKTIIRNINLGKDLDRSDNKNEPATKL